MVDPRIVEGRVGMRCCNAGCREECHDRTGGAPRDRVRHAADRATAHVSSVATTSERSQPFDSPVPAEYSSSAPSATPNREAALTGQNVDVDALFETGSVGNLHKQHVRQQRLGRRRPATVEQRRDTDGSAIPLQTYRSKGGKHAPTNACVPRSTEKCVRSIESTMAASRASQASCVLVDEVISLQHGLLERRDHRVARADTVPFQTVARRETSVCEPLIGYRGRGRWSASGIAIDGHPGRPATPAYTGRASAHLSTEDNRQTLCWHTRRPRLRNLQSQDLG